MQYLEQITDIISGQLQNLQEHCLGTCKIAGIHSFIIEHDPVSGYTVTFQVRESGGTSVDHFTYTPWVETKSVFDNLVARQGQPPISDWQLKETEIQKGSNFQSVIDEGAKQGKGWWSSIEDEY